MLFYDYKILYVIQKPTKKWIEKWIWKALLNFYGIINIIYLHFMGEKKSRNIVLTTEHDFLQR